MGFPGGAVVKNQPANAADTSSSPGPGRSHMLRSNKPVHHNYWVSLRSRACALQPASHNYWSLRPTAHALQRRVAPRSPQLEKAHAQPKKKLHDVGFGNDF